MPQLSAICMSLVIVSVLVQNVSAKRGCAAFGHACYGGHGKRSSTLPEGFAFAGGSAGQLDGLVPLPYAKLSLMDRSKSLDIAPELRAELASGAGRVGESAGIFTGREQSASGQDKFERGMRFAMNAILRQLIEENRPTTLQRQQPDANFQNSETGRQLMDNEQK